MTTRNFVVKNGLTVGNVVIDATSGNLTGVGNAALGNLVTANYFSGAGNNLSNIQGGNVSGQVGNALVASTVYTNAQPNITSVGTLSSLSVSGNIAAGGLLTNNLYYANGNPWDLQNPGGSNTQVQFNDNGDFGGSANFTFDKTTNALSVNGNISGANLVTGGAISATGTATVGNVSTGGTISASGTITGGNVATSGTLSAGGNANVGNLGTTGLFASTVSASGNANVGNLGTGGLITASGTITGGNLATAGTLSVGGNANVGNIGANNAVFTGTGSFGANVNMNSYWINNVGYPNLSTDAATKAYVDNMASTAIAYHQPVLAATTTTLATATGGTVSYNNGTAGVGANLTTTGTFLLIDGANVQTVGTRILVKDEANAAWNGIYEYTSPTVITRTADADEYGPDSTTQLSINDYFFTTGGIVNEGTAFIVSAPAGTITFGTSNITFAQFSTSQVYDAGTGLTLTGTTFSVNASQTQITSVGALTGLSISGNANIGNIGTAGIITASGTATAGNLVTAGILSAGGNANVGNLGTTGLVTAGSLTVSGVSNLGSISNVTITGGSANYLLQTNGSGALSWVAPPSTSTIVNGTSNVSIPSSGGNVNTSVGGVANVLVVTTTGANVTGTLSASGNANVANLGTGIVTATGNIGGANINTAGVVSAGGTITGGNLATSGTLSAGGNANVGNIGTGIVTATGNINGANIITGGIVSATGNGTFGNITTGGLITATGNITGSQIISTVTTGTAPLVVTSTTQVANLNVATAGTVTTAAQPNITSTGTLASVSVSGNANIGNIGTGGLITATGNITGGNINTGGLVSATGNVTGSNLVGTVVTNAVTSNRANISVSTNTVIDQFVPATYRTAKYVISASSDNGYQSVEAILVHDGVNSYISIYGSVCSNVSADIVDVSSNINGVSGNVTLYATSAGSNGKVNLMATYLLT